MGYWSLDAISEYLVYRGFAVDYTSKINFNDKSRVGYIVHRETSFITSQCVVANAHLEKLRYAIHRQAQTYGRKKLSSVACVKNGTVSQFQCIKDYNTEL